MVLRLTETSADAGLAVGQEHGNVRSLGSAAAWAVVYVLAWLELPLAGSVVGEVSPVALIVKKTC